MGKISAGLLMYKIKEGKLKVFIGHHGGPFYKNKDEGSWDFPKGEVEEREDLFETAKREFKEETGISPPENKEKYIYLESIKRKDGKTIHIWAFEGDWTGLLLGTSFVKMEYSLKSGKFIKFPEIDKADFFSIESARKKVWPSLLPFLDRLEEKINSLQM